MNGFYQNLQELKLLLHHYQPKIICIQETHLAPHHSANIPNYSQFRFDYTDGDKAERIKHEKWLQIPPETNKLRQIKLDPKTWKTSIQEHNRRFEVALARLRIGHTKLTHAYLLQKTNPPICQTCQRQNTTKHILTECRKFENDRIQSDLPRRMEDILGDNSECVEKLLNFLQNSKTLKDI